MMDTNRHSKGFQSFLEHWGFLVTPVAALGVSHLLLILARMTGMSRLLLFAVALSLLVTGACLIGYAKLPLYRSGRFFTIGAKSVPEPRRRFYRWGWRAILSGLVLSLCFLISTP